MRLYFPLFITCLSVFYQLKAQVNSEHETFPDPVEPIHEIKHLATYPPRPLIINGIAVPADFPVLDVTLNNSNSEGFLFLNNYNGTPYIMILHDDGTPYFYRKVEDRSREFKVNPGNLLSRRIRGSTNGYQTMDSLYNPEHIWKCTDDYETDDHEFQLTERGTALMIGIDRMDWDLTDSIDNGGPTTLLGNIVQEIDREGNVVFEWHSRDHFSVKDTRGQNMNTVPLDYVHINSIAVDFDENLLISSRHLNECTKIDRKSGEIIWRFGGANNQFQIINDEGFCFQHDFRPVPGKPGYYTMFDNGNLKQPAYSRAVEYKLDTMAMTAEKVWEYSPEPAVFSFWMGNVQRLPNGNTLVNFAEDNLPKFVEVTPGGEILYEANFKKPSRSYRTFRYRWEGIAKRPELTVECYPDMVSLIFQKFGDDKLTSYNIYIGERPGTAKLYTNTSKNWLNIGKEDIPGDRFYYMKVSAVYNDGTESLPSIEEKIYVSFTEPGSNLVMNGDFSQGHDFWDLTLNNESVADCSVDEQEKYSFDISNGGNYFTDVQLSQNGIVLIENEDYIFEFTASSSSPRIIEAIVARGMNPLIDLGRIGPTYLPGPEKRFHYSFKMTNSTVWDARIVINAGTEEGTLKIDDISLRQLTEILDQEKHHPDSPNQLFPNPAAEGFFIKFYSKDNTGKVIQIYDVSGALCKTQMLKNVKTGMNLKEINRSKLKNGLYFLFIKDTQTGQIILNRKLILI